MKTLVIPSENQVIPKKDDSPPFSTDGAYQHLSPHPTSLSPAFFLFVPHPENCEGGTPHGCSSLFQADRPREVWEPLLTSTVRDAGHPKGVKAQDKPKPGGGGGSSWSRLLLLSLSLPGALALSDSEA